MVVCHQSKPSVNIPPRVLAGAKAPASPKFGAAGGSAASVAPITDPTTLLRRKLSVTTAPGQSASQLDGADAGSLNSPHFTAEVKAERAVAAAALAAPPVPPKRGEKPCFKKYCAKSKVGFMQFNPGKVNQDRAMEVPKVGGRDDRSLFGVFDGHGVNGHGVSEFVAFSLDALWSSLRVWRRGIR